MRFKICKLKFKSSLHLGERENVREGTEVFIHSDTLFSAFCHSYLLLYGDKELEDLLARFIQGSELFRLSSAFPYWEDKLYFPVPKNQVPRNKKVKNIMFVEKTGFEQLLAGEQLEQIFEKINTIPKQIDSPEAQEQETPTAPWEDISVPRLELNRFSSHPHRFFHLGEVYYRHNAGLFFLIDFREAGFEPKFKAALNLMAHEGIGGDRSTGKGLFSKPELSEIDFQLAPQEGSITLSLYLPKEKEIDRLDQGYYELIERKGYIYSPYCQNLRRKSVRMFTEGSVFDTNRSGRLADVTPQKLQKHKVYRYGLFFPLPCKLEVAK